MIDREAVVDALRNCINKPKCQNCNWSECEEFHEKFELPKGLVMDMYDLLKEQEAIVGRWISIPHKKARICNICYADEPYKFADDDADVYDFCPHCGAKMKQKGR